MSTTPAILIVSSCMEDHERLQCMLKHYGCSLHSARTYLQASTILRERQVSLVICEQNLSDGTWKHGLRDADALHHRPVLIVISRLAEGALWAEVLNLGGDDVPSKPLDYGEGARLIGSASSAWW